MTNKHTQGPWICTKDKHGIDGNDYQVCVIACCRGDRQLIIHAKDGDDSQADNNARLIAAAPGLLEALELCISKDMLSGEALDKAKEAIAKAKGQ